MLTGIIPTHEIMYSNLQALINCNEFVVTTSPSWSMVIVTPQHGSALTAKEMYKKLVTYTEQGNVIIVEPSFYEFASNCEALYGTTLEQQVDAMNELTKQSEELGLYNNKTMKYCGVFRESFYNGEVKERDFTSLQIQSNLSWIQSSHESELRFLIDYFHSMPNILARCFTTQELQQALTDHKIK